MTFQLVLSTTHFQVRALVSFSWYMDSDCKKYREQGVLEIGSHKLSIVFLTVSTSQKATLYIPALVPLDLST